MVICPDIELVASSFGGGWLVSHTPAGEDFGLVCKQSDTADSLGWRPGLDHRAL
jgi:hypothetical protein